MSKYLSPKSNRKYTITLVSLILILTIGVGGTLAYLITSTGEVKNTFTPSQVNISVDETLNGNTKSAVKISNHNDSVKAYIRAAIVVNWDDGKGNVWAATPVLGTDYTMATGNGWTLAKDGYYYHKGAVNPGELTSDLIDSAAPVAGMAPDGYYLSIEILAQGIQADGVDSTGKTPVELAWGTTAAGLVK